ncbi:DUF5302 domain-containing protein [Thermostaphylospora chromogena]|jgi:hypothetical protein|uniref:DUF5302 domain-containing protein n=1 Tax=Thermostaphylospora chromogena TaxID=35622 RepID=A0A1H0ZVK7_9ACTN|nr:DUF5302 domain-containing protein [Thermostaphylospora chromogena]SDQ31477.1 hypothetical protein SAMN04489764_0170 [Thermostaphylospora chromogena]
MSATGSESETPEDLDAEVDPGEEFKRRFREALERKRRAHSAEGSGGVGRGGSKIHGTHGPAAYRRSFRRKSG